MGNLVGHGFVGSGMLLSEIGQPILATIAESGVDRWRANLGFFFPFRSIQVSPIGARFFSERGLQVVGSEICWVGLPSLLLAMGVIGWRIWRNRKEVSGAR